MGIFDIEKTICKKGLDFSCFSQGQRTNNKHPLLLILGIPPK